MAHPREILKTLGIAAILHGVFTIGLPWLLVDSTSRLPWASVSLGPLRWIGLMGLAFGAYLYIWAVVRLLSRGLSALPGQRPTTLQMDGWYATVRHPLLLGVVLILLGEAMAAESLVLVVYAVAYWLWLNVFVAWREEPELRASFGEAYASYCQRVPRWIPYGMALLLKNLLFTILVPGTVAVYVPILIARSHPVAPGLGTLLAAAVLALGIAIYTWCVWDFATFGRGTPAPIDAPRKLVVRGLYRYTRNPMYVGVLTVILGWAILFRTAALVVYALVIATCFHLFIILYEEPHLEREFGHDYEQYRAQVGRWLPRPRRARLT